MLYNEKNLKEAKNQWAAEQASRRAKSWKCLSLDARSRGTKAVLGHSLALASQGSRKQCTELPENAICHSHIDNQTAASLKAGQPEKGLEKSLLTSLGALLLTPFHRWLSLLHNRLA